MRDSRVDAPRSHITTTLINTELLHSHTTQIHVLQHQRRNNSNKSFYLILKKGLELKTGLDYSSSPQNRTVTPRSHSSTTVGVLR